MYKPDTQKKNQKAKVTFQNGAKIVNVQLDLQRLVRTYISFPF